MFPAAVFADTIIAGNSIGDVPISEGIGGSSGYAAQTITFSTSVSVVSAAIPYINGASVILDQIRQGSGAVCTYDTSIDEGTYTRSHFTGCNLTAGTYYLILSSNSSGVVTLFGSSFDNYPQGEAGNTSLSGSFSNSNALAAGVHDFQFSLCSDSDCTVGDSSTGATRIVSVLPVASSTVATSTTTGGSVYINPADFVSGMNFTVQFTNQTKATSLSYSAADAYDRAVGTGVLSYTFPILSSGFTSFSTSTTFAFSGLTFGNYQIVSPNFLSSIPFIGGFFNPTTKAALSDSFTVNALTPLDQAISVGQTAVASYSLYGTNATNTPVELYCNPLSSSPAATFSIVSCAGILIIPSSDQMLNVWNQLYAQVLQRAPWGYLTRFVTILTGQGTTTLPVIAIETPLGRPGSPEYTDGMFHFDPGNMLAGGALLLNTVHTSYGGDFSVQQVFQPLVDLSLALALFMAIIHDLFGMGNHKKRNPHALH